MINFVSLLFHFRNDLATPTALYGDATHSFFTGLTYYYYFNYLEANFNIVLNFIKSYLSKQKKCQVATVMSSPKLC